MNRVRVFASWLLVCLATGSGVAAQAPPRPSGALTIVNAGPQGEIANLAEAREIRIVFSEPMVPLGLIPPQVQPRFVKISPALAGSFRWSGTTILILTPDPKRPLAFATTYRITVDRTATAVSGRALARAVTFQFTTPTVKLLNTEWYRRGGRYDGALVVALRFNQRVRPADIAAHLRASLAPHQWSLPDLEGLRARLAATDPPSLQQFDAKVAVARAVAASTAPVRIAVASDWDKKRFPPKPDLVVIETLDRVLPESWVRLELDARLASPAGPATPGSPQDHTVQVERALFIDRVECTVECNPDNANVIWFRSPVKVPDFARATSLRDVTGGREVALAKPHPPRQKDEYGNTRDIETTLSLEDAGFDAPAPAHTYVVTVDRGLQSADGQTLGYTWLGRIENWHRPAFTSFGDGHGVWETGGGTLLPFYARNFQNATEWASTIQPRDLMPTHQEARGQRVHRAAVGRRTDAATRRLARSHSVARPRHRRRARTRKDRPGVGRREARPSDRAGQDLRRQRHTVDRRPGDEPRHQRQGQPAEHAHLRDASRYRRPCRRRRGLHRPPRQHCVLARADRC